MSIFTKYSSLTTVFLLLFTAVITGINSVAQAQNDPELIAKNLFEQEKYADALPYFRDLVDLYPKDELLNYYFAACLVETQTFSNETKLALQNAFGDETPDKIFYYQAQVFHAEGNFELAAEFYQRFLDVAKRKSIKSTRVKDLLKLCQQGINPFESIVEEQEQAPELEDGVETVVNIAPEKEIESKPVEIPEELKENLINFQVTPTIKYLKIDQFKNKSSVAEFIKGWQLEQSVENLLEKTSSLRDQYATASETKKQELAENILQLEKETYDANQQANAFYVRAREEEIAYWDQAKPNEVSKFVTHINFMEDSIAGLQQAAIEDLVAEPLELPEEVVEEITPEATQQASNQVVYKIQIGAYSKTPPDWVQRLFKKLSVIRKIDQYTDDSGVTVYTVGELSSFSDALQMQSQVRLEGVKDAFVAAYKNGERISVNEAKKITE